MQNPLNDPEPDNGQCESCLKELKRGDKYTVTLDGCDLCEECAPTFQDCVDYWNEHPPEDRDEKISAHDCKEALDAHVAEGGSPTDKPLYTFDN